MPPIINASKKSIKQSLEDLQQGLEQLKLNLRSAQYDNNQQLIKDISRSIKLTEMVIRRLKDESAKKAR